MTRISFSVALFIFFGVRFAAQAQDLGPGFTKVKDGIYVFAAADEATTTCSFVLTEQGVVMIDSCMSPIDSHKVLAAIKKITDKPIVFLIDTETHGDHTGNHYIFSPPATIISHEGAGTEMRKVYNPNRPVTLSPSAEMIEALKGSKLITPHVEYRDRMTLNFGERRFELIYLKNVHSVADTAVWLPNERVLFAASAANVRRFINLRPTVVLSDVLASFKLMKSLDPEVVITGHGPVTTTRTFDEYEAFYTLLLKRVGDLVAQGKPLDEIKKELKMPEYADWRDQERLGANIDAAYRAVKR